MKRRAVKTLIMSLLGTAMLGGAVEAAPMKVYILAGQSNMEGHAQVSTFPYVKKDPKTRSIYRRMVGSNGTPVKSSDVYISLLTNSGGWGNDQPVEKNGALDVGFGAQNNGPKIGPEYTFGLYMHRVTRAPVLLIKTAWGGKSLHTDFRSPSAGPFKFNEHHIKRLKAEGKDLEKEKAEKEKATGAYYKLMMDHVKKVLKEPKKYHPAYNEKDGYEIAGFIWFQGWNDMVDGNIYPNRYKNKAGYSLYSKLLAHFIRDVRTELNAEDMRFVIGVLGIEGPTKDYQIPELKQYTFVHQNFRDAMAAPAAMPEFKGNVKTVLTEKFWDKELGDLDFYWRQKVKAKRKELVNDKSLTKEQRDEGLQEFINKNFSTKQQDLMKNAKSHAGYHYLGSAKIVVQIGKAFAEAMHKMEKHK